MKRFSLITETDARLLETGEVVELAAGGHVTPLARDTLREKRVTVIGAEEAGEDGRALVPVMPVKRLAIGCDHTGRALQQRLVKHLRGRGLSVDDQGAESAEPVDYPDVAARVAQSVVRGEADAGIVIDGAGLGSAIAANKVPGIRAAMCNTETLARYAREHNGANVLALGATLLSEDEAVKIVEIWLGTPMREPRYIRRLLKIRRLERK